MKKIDIPVLLVIGLTVMAFLLFPKVSATYNYLNNTHGMWMSFAKFAILATFGESLGLRLRTGNYNQKGFGLIPRAIVWGFLGLTIKMAFVVFATGTPAFLSYLGIAEATVAMQHIFTPMKLLVAFSISSLMNLIYAPVMMTLHRITDTHIIENNGTIRGLFRPIRFRKIFNELDWDNMWNFVFKKTIPFFWIPAHTITFLLPESFQVLFAALLGIALGIILNLARR
jgi:hypothetical protein